MNLVRVAVVTLSLFALQAVLAANQSPKVFQMIPAGQQQCPPLINSLAEAGCLRLPENPKIDSSRIIQIYFGFANPFDVTRDTVVVLNGGPGGTIKDYSQEKTLRSLSEHFNVMFYDQRGIGMSSVLTAENLAGADLTYYSTPVNSWDLEQLRRYVVGTKYNDTKRKVIIAGHSYGGHLAYQYAADYQANVKKLIVLNGASTWEGFLLQTKARMMLLTLDLNIPGVTRQEGRAFLDLMFKNQLKDPKDPKKTVNSGDVIAFWKQRYTVSKGQDDFVKIALQIFNANKDLIRVHAKKGVFDSLDSQSPLVPQEEISFHDDSTITSRLSFDSDQHINTIVNQRIVCHEFINKAAITQFMTGQDIDLQFRQEVQAEASKFLGEECPKINPKLVHPFNVRERIKDLIVPIMIVGGENDPLISPWTQFTDYKKINGIEAAPMTMSDRIVFFRNFHPTKQASLVYLHQAGHQMAEGGECLKEKIRQFLTDESFAHGFYECKNQ